MCDFSKAFDLVNYNIPLIKLSQLGGSGSLLSWIGEFHGGRLMKVVVGGAESAPTEVCSGVPQGSVLKPTLFLIYINFLDDGLCCKYMIFANDLKIYIKIYRLPNSFTLLSLSTIQQDIDIFVWPEKNSGALSSTLTRQAFSGSAMALF